MTMGEESRPGSVGSVVHEIVDRIADREGVEPTELPALSQYTDPAALNALLKATESIEITFELYGYEATVDADETVRIEPI
ncbi:HalOD1 output domain-containing protein [Haloarcula amylovorans]|uniref:HalOD1 output domain-containing protein n=1 Tax=Haloarcula amylovorans TaxID=2562280 RepID=UPI0010769E68|nr:HalOD1 output domain-containing protein [Halomicroarcula amylolytica]